MLDERPYFFPQKQEISFNEVHKYLFSVPNGYPGGWPLVAEAHQIIYSTPEYKEMSKFDIALAVRDKAHEMQNR